MRKESRLLAFQIKVINFYDNMPVLAWGSFSLIVGLATWHTWAVIIPLLTSAEPDQPAYHFGMATLFTAVGLFMAYCRIRRLDIVLRRPEVMNILLHSHDGPISPEILEILSEVADEYGVRGKFEAFLAQYDPDALPTTQVVYGMLLTLAEESMHEKSH
ncbi:hypothetical protein [Serratia fonticola]|uniref:hypothetical protein n=1 Tax=Serratia fonticola TaxID=47917 RepID=UPI000E0FD970|nr:hypothetical protein [Serratia fonticola]RDL15594.1 hypothetical protein DFO62_1234 [Serratia fonticola]